jgi:hypothetical protein
MTIDYALVLGSIDETIADLPKWMKREGRSTPILCQAGSKLLSNCGSNCGKGEVHRQYLSFVPGGEYDKLIMFRKLASGLMNMRENEVRSNSKHSRVLLIQLQIHFQTKNSNYIQLRMSTLSNSLIQFRIL